jgi:hypothetical protein
MPCTDLHPSVLWCNRQTEAHLILRLKLRNRRGDFEGQITKPKLPVLRPNREKPSPPVLRSNWRKSSQQVLRPNRQKPSQQVLRPNHQKPSQQVLRPNRQKPSTLVLRLNQETRLLVSTCMVQTAHGATRPLDHPAIEYPTCVTILDPLH